MKVGYEVIINLIANSRTKTGLTIQSQLDTTEYARGIKVSDKEIAALNIDRAGFHGEWSQDEWNYTISPRIP